MPRSAVVPAPYWRLSGFYLFYFATLGALIPYWGLYLQSIGFSAVQIGNLMALLVLSRVVAPNVWGWLADHGGQRLHLVRVAALLAALSYGGVFFGTSFAWLALVMSVFTFFWHASLPQLEALTISHLGDRYGRVRLWGSIGFIVAVLSLGPVLDSLGTRWLLPTILALLIGILLFTLLLPEVAHRELPPATAPFRKALLRPEVLAFLAVCFLMQASHGPYYTFYSIYLNGIGYSKSVIGVLWAFAVLCEIGVFIWVAHLLRRFGLSQWFLASFVLAATRWLAIGFGAEHFWLLLAAQVLHAASFGIYHAMAIQLVHRFFTGRHQIRGQALFGSVSGAGGAFGSVYSGFTWQASGAAASFGIAAAIAAMAFVISYRWIRPAISRAT